jgi:5-formyltetrahydrofolate cyclo-ligase
MNKSLLRKEIIKKRDSIKPELRRDKSRLIQKRLTVLKEYREAKTVLLFASFDSEVDTSGIIDDALQRGKRVVLPKVDTEEKRLALYSIKTRTELKPGFKGIPEPDSLPEREVSLEEIDFILVPGVAFDENGGRLGYGGGYYDKLLGGLNRKPHLVAVAFEEQILEKVPVSNHDIRIPKIVTDQRIIEINK